MIRLSLMYPLHSKIYIIRGMITMAIRLISNLTLSTKFSFLIDKAILVDKLTCCITGKCPSSKNYN